MSETTEAGATAAKSKKPETVYTTVKMTDGREAKFAGTRKIDKTVLLDGSETAIGVRFDYVNGETRTVLLSDLPTALVSQSACHGISQKVGDSSAGAKDKEMTVEDIVMTHDEMIQRLVKGDWFSERASGDSMAGASIIIRALCEASPGKTPEQIKAFLDKKLESTQGLTRQALYASFRNPTSKVGQIIRRLEDERLAKSAAVNADDVLGELGAS